MHSSHWGAFRARVEGGRLTGVEPFERDTHPSPILDSVAGLPYAPSRIRQPMVREGYLAHGPDGDRSRRGRDAFVAVEWDRALDLVAEAALRVRDTHGNASIFAGSYGWASAGRFHHAPTLLRRFYNCIGGATRHVHNYSIAAGLVIVPHVLGDSETVWGRTTTYESLEHSTRLLVAFGGIAMKNAQVESGGMGDHGTATWVSRLNAKGVRMVLVSPLRDDLPAFADVEWLAPRPGTDTALMLGLAHTLYTERLHDTAFLERHCTGFERFLPYLTGDADGVAKTAEWAAGICAIDAHRIRGLARAMASTRTFITVSWSLQRAEHGEQPYWMAITLAAMLGQIGLPGGGMSFGFGSTNGMGLPFSRVSPLAMSEGIRPIESQIPVARITDMLENPGGAYDFDGRRLTYPDIALIHWAGGNPFHHHQDLNRLERAWTRPETIVVNEIAWTATARRADIVLPATTSLERNDIAMSKRDRFICAMQQAIAPVDGARNDFDIFTDLARRFGCEAAYTEGRDERAWLLHLYEATRRNAMDRGVEMPAFEDFWATGWYELPIGPSRFDIYADFRADPARHPLATPSGRIELWSDRIAGFGYQDCPGHAVWITPEEWLGGARTARFPLHLVSNQPRTRLHSQIDDGVTSVRAKIRGREAAWMHPADARARGIREGDVIRIRNDRGACLAGAHLTEAVMQGVLMLPTGAWFDPADPDAPGALERHGNPNVLTPDRGTSRLGQGPISHSCLVQAERFDGTLPPITVFDPPAIRDDPMAVQKP
jgi:biotin/methionine sulfoxide reductase